VKGKHGQTIYYEDIYFPVEFKVRSVRLPVWPFPLSASDTLFASSLMPAILIGWVQNNIHVQFEHQSLN